MKERYLIGNCKCCGDKVESTFPHEEKVHELTLDGYKEYKNIEINVCPNCGFVSENIFLDNVSDEQREVVESEDYRYVLEYAYLREEVSEDVWGYDIQALNPNEYEAYSLILDEKKEYEKEIRALYKCIELKERLIKHLRKKQNEECDNCDWSEEYDKIEKAMRESIEINFEEIEDVYLDVKQPSVFLELLHVEALAKSGEKEKAQKKFSELRKNSQIEKDLVDHFMAIFA